ncbi:MAG: type II secretion system F family protein [Candidatus Magasanikbacteria bacterium]
MEDKKEKTLSPFEQKLNNFFSHFFGRISFVQKMLFVFHLQIMTKAGLSIVASLKILSEEVENKKFKLIIGEIKTEVEKGRQLSEVLAEYPKVFPSIYVSMIAAGEAAGKMEEALTQVSNQMKKSHQLTSSIRGAMIYPAVVLTAILGISIEMVVFILPKIMIMFADFKSDLPLATKILINTVKFTQSYGIHLLIGFILLIILFFWALKNIKFKKYVHHLTLKLPIFGGVIKKINLAKFTLTLSSLLESTIPIVEAVKITSSVQTNLLYHDSLIEVSEALKRGDNLSKILTRYPEIFPPMVTEMIMVGEEAGKMDDMLKELAEYYGNEVDATMKNFSVIIEPVIIVVLGLVVAGIAVAVIMPMYTLAQNF